ncbi:glycoside hydrolase family 30 beta sandwich domain-containing protein [Microbacterium sp. NPDC091313]
MTDAARTARWISTTEHEPWRERGPLPLATPEAMPDVIVDLAREQQVIEGFGATFNELGWHALQLLDDAARDDILRTLFSPGDGASLTLCRMPVGANDFAADWYSYDEVEGDFALEHFSIERDRGSLIPFIRAAKAHQPELSLWASPWSPPTWMKVNGHYAGAPGRAIFGVDNGIRPDQLGAEGTDMMRQDEATLDAYARYFGRFIDAYREEGIEIGMVMPQNEFSSPQPFPSCTWTPEGLARFLRHLGPEMTSRGVDVFIGTLERSDEDLLEPALQDPEAGEHIVGAGFQWAGKRAVAGAHSRRKDLRIYQTEQECGDGRNSWVYARYAWSMMRHYLQNGANAYTYWNIALLDGGRSTWGWTQNSLVVVDPESRTHRFTHEFHLLRHLTQFVRAGARVVETVSLSGHDNLLAFRNPDGDVVVIAQNDLAVDASVSFLVGEAVLSVDLPADSFNTFVVPAA